MISGPQTIHRFFLLMCLALALSGCAPLIRSEQLQREGSLPLSAVGSAGQTFRARYQGLNGIAVFLKSGQKTSGNEDPRLVLRLLPAPGSPIPGAPAPGTTTNDATSLGVPAPGSSEGLALASLPLDEVVSPGYYRFYFPPQGDSAGRDYYFELASAEVDKAPGSGVRLAAGPAQAYLNGSRYQEGLPAPGQLAFKLLYDPIQAGLGLARTILTWLLWLATGGLLLVLPGWGLLAWLLPGWDRLTWGERLGLAGGTSLALAPLLWLWSDTLGLQLGPLYAWGMAALGAIAVLGRLWWKARRERHKQGLHLEAAQNQKAVRAPQNSFTERLPDLAWLLLFALLVFTRFWPARWLETPLWGDGYHHTLIAELLVEQGGLFQSWEPYAELQTFTYHFGFHTLAAGFHWLSGLPLPQSTLWTGQLVNLLAVLSLYPLAARLCGDRWAGVGAVLVAGLLAPMPQVYTNWGRYTQLAGQAILPAAVWLAWEALEVGQGESQDRTQDTGGWLGRTLGRRSGAVGSLRLQPVVALALLAALTFAGLALTHYRVLIFALLFFPGWMALNARRVRLRTWLNQTLAIGVSAGLLFLPWFLRLYGGVLMQAFTRQARTPAAQTPAAVEVYNTLGSLSDYLPGALWALLGLAVILAFWRRERDALVVALWWGLIVLAANPGWLGLPGAGILSNFAVFIGMYFPAAVLVGSAFSWGMRGITKVRTTTYVLFGLLMVLAVLGAQRRVGEIQPGQYALVTAPDSRAAAWIQANLPQSARFLVNSFFAYSDTLVVGSDAGWWLPLLAERQTTLPPITYSSEQGPRPDYIPWTNALVATVRDLGLGHPETLNQLQARGVTHIFIGQRQGQVGGPALFEPDRLLADQHFRPVYRQDRVWIFEIEY